jgi:hypothetical protein
MARAKRSFTAPIVRWNSRRLLPSAGEKVYTLGRIRKPEECEVSPELFIQYPIWFSSVPATNDLPKSYKFWGMYQLLDGSFLAQELSRNDAYLYYRSSVTLRLDVMPGVIQELVP